MFFKTLCYFNLFLFFVCSDVISNVRAFINFSIMVGGEVFVGVCRRENVEEYSNESLES